MTESKNTDKKHKRKKAQAQYLLTNTDKVVLIGVDNIYPYKQDLWIK